MRPWTVIPIGVIAASLLLSLLLWSRAATAPPPPDMAPRSGMDLLQAYRCRGAETKRVILRGVEDGFSIAGSEPMRIRDGRRTMRTLSFKTGAYDQSEPDHWLIDYLETPARISRGLIVISLKPVSEDANDVMAMGDLADLDHGEFFQAPTSTLATRPGWRRIGAAHYAEIDQVHLDGRRARIGDPRAGDPTPTLLDQVRAGEGTAQIDVQVLDDTSVDFIGLAVCEQPPAGMGLTYAERTPAVPDGLVSLACWSVTEGEHVCQPLRGDTPCDTALPVACFRSQEDPAPVRYWMGKVWSGGAVRFSSPTTASRFRRVGDVNAFCRAQFGPDWRIASFHDGLSPGELLARGDASALSSRVWVDIQDQPYATCWAR